jgi:hypothetical protein
MVAMATMEKRVAIAVKNEVLVKEVKVEVVIKTKGGVDEEV